MQGLPGDHPLWAVVVIPKVGEGSTTTNQALEATAHLNSARCLRSSTGSKRCWVRRRLHSRRSRPVWVDSRPGPKAPYAETLVNPSPVSTKRMTYLQYLPKSRCTRW